jgi:hypothetical protein
MNGSPNTSIALPSRPPVGRTCEGNRQTLRGTLHAMLSRWRLHRALARKAHALDTLGLNAHMLRDIGAPHENILRAVAGRDAHHWREVPF